MEHMQAFFAILTVGLTLANLVVLGFSLKLYTEFAKERFKGDKS